MRFGAVALMMSAGCRDGDTGAGAVGRALLLSTSQPTMEVNGKQSERVSDRAKSEGKRSQ